MDKETLVEQVHSGCSISGHRRRKSSGATVTWHHSNIGASLCRMLPTQRWPYTCATPYLLDPAAVETNASCMPQCRFTLKTGSCNRVVLNSLLTYLLTRYAAPLGTPGRGSMPGKKSISYGASKQSPFEQKSLLLQKRFTGDMPAEVDSAADPAAAR